MFATPSASEAHKSEITYSSTHSLKNNLTKRLWKVLNPGLSVGIAGTTCGYYIGKTMGARMIDASVRYACKRFINGMLGKIVASFAAPFFASNLAKFAVPAGLVTGSAGSLAVYYSASQIYGYCSSTESQAERKNHKNIETIIETLYITSALDPKNADDFLNALTAANPELAEAVLKCLAEVVLEMEYMGDDFEVVDFSSVSSIVTDQRTTPEAKSQTD